MLCGGWACFAPSKSPPFGNVPPADPIPSVRPFSPSDLPFDLRRIFRPRRIVY